jgi:hypothetical protein
MVERRLEAERRADRAVSLATWVAKHRRLSEAEAEVREVDSAYGELASAALTAAGYHKPGRGRWRKRRGDEARNERALLVLRDLLAGAPVRLRPPVEGEVEALRDELGGPNASDLERSLCNRVAWTFFAALGRDVAAIEAAKSKTLRQEIDYLDRLRTQSNDRFLAACRDLVLVWRLASPVLLIRIGSMSDPCLDETHQRIEPRRGELMATTLKEIERNKSDRTQALLGRATSGDEAAFDELQSIRDYATGFSAAMILVRLQERAGGYRDLISRAGVAKDLAAVAADLSDRSDGPIERLIVKRAALCAVDAGLADLEHIRAVPDSNDPAHVESLDRRRDRAHRRLLQTLKTLCEVRRLNRVAVQVNVGDGNINVMKA